VDGIVEAIIKAEGNLRNAKLSINTGTFELDKEVAYQRSIDAYNLNPEVKTKISFKDRHLALDREMTLLKIEGEKGENIGSINWFGVHTTSLPNTNTKNRVLYPPFGMNDRATSVGVSQSQRWTSRMGSSQ
jgi:neutral ceramidase